MPRRLNCFVIMPFGHPNTEAMWEQVYKPTIRRCGCNPQRIDGVERGGLIPLEIINHLQQDQIIVADLTFARRNCYFEVGYAMGLGKESRIVLCCREDHSVDSPRFEARRNKVHFDLLTYSILWWNPRRLRPFATSLTLKLRQRIRALGEPQIIGDAPTTPPEKRLRRGGRRGTQ